MSRKGGARIPPPAKVGGSLRANLMAVTALDNPTASRPAGLYFAGRDLLAMSLKEPFPAGDDAASSKAREHQYTRVRRAVKELIDDGAIEREGDARDGCNQEYRLRLDAEPRLPRKPSNRGGPRRSSSRQGGYGSPPEGGCHGLPQGGCDSPQRGAAVAPPRKDGGGVQELREKKSVDLDTAVTGPRARDPSQDPVSELAASPDPQTPKGDPMPTEEDDRPVPPTPASAEPVDERPVPAAGHGFCLACYAAEQTVLAADPVAGSACAWHIRNPA